MNIPELEKIPSTPANNDLQLLKSMQRMLMQTPDDLRREIISRMGAKDREILLGWLDNACGQYSYHLCKFK